MGRWSHENQRRQALAIIAATGHTLASNSSADGVATGLGRYRLLASAIAGRTVEVASGAPHELPWTDGSSIFVDPDETPGNVLASVAVQAALLGAGSLGREVTAALLRRPMLVGRYLAVEGHRALQVHEALLPPPVRRVANWDVARSTDSPAASLALASGRGQIDEPPTAFGTILPRRMRAPIHSSQQGGIVGQHTPRRGGESALRELDDANDDVGPVIDLLSSPVGGGGGLGRLLKKLFGDARSGVSGPPGADAPTHGSRRSTRRAATVTLSTSVARVSDLATMGHHRVATYPEWDQHRRCYKPDWCTVEEVEPGPGELVAFWPPNAHALRRPLGRLGMEFERRHRQLQGDDIDIDAAVEAVIELKAGSDSDGAVYLDSVRGRRDLSVLVLLDISGSAGEPGALGVPLHVHQRDAAGSLTVALHELGDRIALYGFRSQGRSAVHIVPVKRFDEEFDTTVLQRLGGLVPGAYTRLGAAMRHGTAVLTEEAGTARRLLVVLSDGLAYDHGYERAYGEADARRALAEARWQGIGCVCLSIGTDADSGALSRVFGTAAYAAIPRVELLPTVVGPLFRSALRSAEQQRRVFQRRARMRGHLEIERGTA